MAPEFEGACRLPTVGVHRQDPRDTPNPALSRTKKTPQMAAPFPRSDEVVRVVYPVPSEHLPGFGEDHGFTTIAIWNRKGGVGKTTMTHALGFGLALRGKRVLMVDASPQCDLSLLLLGMKWVRNRQRIADTRTGESDDDLSSHLKVGAVVDAMFYVFEA